MVYTGSCYCKEIQYELDINSPDEARSSICYCSNCKKWTGSAFTILTKIPRRVFRLIRGKPAIHTSDNGSGTTLTREFCQTCGGGIMDYSENAGGNVYLTYGSLDNPEEFPPHGEFHCKDKPAWMPEISGIFSKHEIHE